MIEKTSAQMNSFQNLQGRTCPLAASLTQLIHFIWILIGCFLIETQISNCFLRQYWSALWKSCRSWLWLCATKLINRRDQSQCQMFSRNNYLPLMIWLTKNFIVRHHTQAYEHWSKHLLGKAAAFCLLVQICRHFGESREVSAPLPHWLSHLWHHISFCS